MLTNAAHVSGSPAWIQLAPTGTAPAPRLEQSAVYDVNTNSMIVFGGNDCFQTDFADVWVLSNANGLGGTPTWKQLTPSGTPPSARSGASAVYDSADNELIVFAGEDSTGSVNNDVWVLSGANGSGGAPAWTQLSPSGGPPTARVAQTAVYDATNNRMTIFGGDSATALLGDVWVLSDANGLGGTPTWIELGSFSTFAEARAFHAAVYDPSTNKMIVFGGATGTGLGTNDVWVLSHANGL